jgi:tRNA threonylcarbamoyladenosine biosynthesis protein TsaB
MRAIAVDTTGPVLGVAALDEGAIVYRADFDTRGRHLEVLAPQLELLQRHTGWPLSSVDWVGASAGPGSFTGLRIGVASAKGLAQAAGAPLVLVPALESWVRTELALRWGLTGTLPRVEMPTAIVALIDARKSRHYVQSYLIQDQVQPGFPEISAVDARRDATLEELVALAERITDGTVCLVGPAQPDAHATLRASFSERVRVIAALSDGMSAAAGVLLGGALRFGRGDTADVYAGPDYAREGDIGVRKDLPTFSPGEATEPPPTDP